MHRLHRPASDARFPTWLPAGTFEIGWRLAPEYLGQGLCDRREPRAWLDFGFEKLDLQEIISFAVWGNRRSTAVMERLGMRRDPADDFDHPHVSGSHPHLKRHVLYRLKREDWLSHRR